MNHEETAKRIVAIMEACGLSIRDAAAFGVSANTVVRLKGGGQRQRRTHDVLQYTGTSGRCRART